MMSKLDCHKMLFQFFQSPLPFSFLTDGKDWGKIVYKIWVGQYLFSAIKGNVCFSLESYSADLTELNHLRQTQSMVSGLCFQI